MKRDELVKFDFALGALFTASIGLAAYLFAVHSPGSSVLWYLGIVLCFLTAWCLIAIRAAGLTEHAQYENETSKEQPTTQNTRVRLTGDQERERACKPENADSHAGNSDEQLLSLPTIIAHGSSRVFSWADQHGVAITALFTLAIALFTCALWISTDKLWQAGVDESTNTEKFYVSQQRAWIGPSTAMMQPLIIGQGAKASIAFTNTGREPAPFNELNITTEFSKTDWNNGNASLALEKFGDQCARMMSSQLFNRIVFPTTGPSTYTESVDTANPDPFGRKYLVDPDLTKGDKILTIFTCFVYFSGGADRHSANCFYYDSSVTVLPNLNICAAGNRID